MMRKKVENCLFTYVILIVDPTGGMPSNINVIYTSLQKYIQWAMMVSR